MLPASLFIFPIHFRLVLKFNRRKHAAFVVAPCTIDRLSNSSILIITVQIMHYNFSILYHLQELFFRLFRHHYCAVYRAILYTVPICSYQCIWTVRNWEGNTLKVALKTTAIVPLAYNKSAWMTLHLVCPEFSYHSYSHPAILQDVGHGIDASFQSVLYASREMYL